MSSVSQNSYLRGRTLGGPWFGLGRFGELGWLEATTEVAFCDVFSGSDSGLRLLLGDRGVASTLIGLIGEMLGSGGASATAGWDS
jgi:hypothetical protein